MVDVRTRFRKLMAFEPVDRIPLLEWATWWDKTIARWHGEGLPEHLSDAGDIRDYFGQDAYRQMGVGIRKRSCPAPAYHGAGIVSDMAGYLAVKEHLYPDPGDAFDRDRLQTWAERQGRGEMVVWLTLEGFFWYPRTLLGIEGHLTALCEQPGTVHAINEDLLEFNLRVLDAFCDICVPDFMTFAEDMSYRGGPMVSRAFFDTFQTPNYKRLVPRILERGILPFVDSDGDVTDLIPLLKGCGVEGPDSIPAEARGQHLVHGKPPCDGVQQRDATQLVSGPGIQTLDHPGAGTDPDARARQAEA